MNFKRKNPSILSQILLKMMQFHSQLPKQKSFPKCWERILSACKPQKTLIQTQKTVPSSHGNDYQKYGFCYQPHALKAAENLNSLYSKNRSRFPRSHLLCRVSVLGTTLIGIESKQKSWILFYVGSDSILSVGVEA